jgi:hypothetical protein
LTKGVTTVDFCKAGNLTRIRQSRYLPEFPFAGIHGWRGCRHDRIEVGAKAFQQTLRTHHEDSPCRSGDFLRLRHYNPAGLPGFTTKLGPGPVSPLLAQSLVRIPKHKQICGFLACATKQINRFTLRFHAFGYHKLPIALAQFQQDLHEWFTHGDWIVKGWRV